MAVEEQNLPPQLGIARGHPRGIEPAAGRQAEPFSGVTAAKAAAATCGKWLIAAKASIVLVGSHLDGPASPSAVQN